MKNLIIILVVVVLVVLLYNFFKKKNEVVSYASGTSSNTSSSNITNYAGANTSIPSTSTPPIVPLVNKYIYIQSKYTTGIKVYTNSALTSFVTLIGGSYVGELKEIKIIGGYEFYVTTSGRLVQKIFSELKSVK